MEGAKKKRKGSALNSDNTGVERDGIVSSTSKKRKREVDKDTKIANVEKKSQKELINNDSTFLSFFEDTKIEKVINAMQKIVQAKSLEDKQIFSEYKYMLDIVCFKTPNCPKRLVRLLLKHALISDDDHVCLIIRDEKRNKYHTIDETKLEKYVSILRDAGVENATAMSFAQLKKEYSSFELKSKLRSTYDVFLIDGSISSHVIGFLGKKSLKKPTFPIRMNSKNTILEIKTALRKTSFLQDQNKHMVSIPVGTNKMSIQHLTDNIISVVNQSKKSFPGGYENMRSIYLRVNMTSTKSVPIYISLRKPEQPVPFIVGPRETKMKKIRASGFVSKVFPTIQKSVKKKL